MSSMTTMGELAAKPPDDKNGNAFFAVVSIMDQHFPRNWREWEVHNLSFRELFGDDQISMAVEVKLRFALPTLDLARAFNPSATSLSERAYKTIRNTLVNWPLGRALIYAPHKLMEKIHEPSYDEFMDTVEAIKPLMIRRRAASADLSESATQASTTSSSKKRSRETPVSEIDDSQPRRPRGGPRIDAEGSSGHLLAAVLSQQTELFNRMINMQAEQNENIQKLIQRATPETTSTVQKEDLDSSFESVPDSTSAKSEVEEVHEDRPGWSEKKEDQEEILRAKIAEAQRQLAELQSTELSFDFTPTTTEREPKIAKAGTKAVEVGRDCQKLGQSGWNNVRFADIQKQFQATPIFTSLKANNLLASVTPKWKSVEILERFDLTLGAITHGLIQHRLIFQSLLNCLPSDIKRRVGKDFVEADSEFRKSSDALIQYTCGRRAEVLKDRRNLYRPQISALRGILHDIPPSDTHLFEDKALSEAIKEQGGIHKFFPQKKWKPSAPRVATDRRETKIQPRKFQPTTRYDRKDSRKTAKSGKPFHPTKDGKRPQKFFNQGGKPWEEGRK